MKIAVTYNNGEVSGHFGHAELFQIYETDEKQILSTSLVEPEGAGHHYMSNLMKEHGVEAVICTSMGMHAKDALDEAGIQSVIGIEGNADEAVLSYLRGELVSGEASACCHGGSCHSEAEAMPILYEGTNAGKTVRVHYKGTFNDGSQFDSSYDRNEALEFVCGAGMMIPGFDRAVLEMQVGQELDIHLEPSEAYGEADPNAIFTLKISELPGSEELSVGQSVYLSNQMGQPFPVTVKAKDEESITLDANHELAGKELNFHIQLVEIL